VDLRACPGPDADSRTEIDLFDYTERIPRLLFGFFVCSSITRVWVIRMSEQNSPHPEQVTSGTKRRPFRWLIEPKHTLLPLTGLWILAWDWLLFSTSALSLGLAVPIAMVIGFVVGGAGTLYFQRRFAGDALWKAALKALVAGIFVGAPWPLAGTLLGGWVLLASGTTSAKGELLRG
jgi:hypothetical protein